MAKLSQTDRYGFLQDALDQAMTEGQSAAEKRQHEMAEMQKMVATGDGMSALLTLLIVATLLAGLFYLPPLLRGDFSGTTTLTVVFSFLGSGLLWLLLRRLRG